MKALMKMYKFILTGILSLFFFGCGIEQKSNALPLIAQHDFMELDKIEKLKVHWIEGNEPGQFLMVLSYLPYESFIQPQNIEIYVPIDGKIESVIPKDVSKPLENVALTVHSIDDSTIQVEMFGIDLNSDEWGAGKTVKAGMQVGYVHISDVSKYSSICVIHQSDEQKTSQLFLDITVDFVFEHYRQRKIQERDSINPFLLYSDIEPSTEKSYEFILR